MQRKYTKAQIKAMPVGRIRISKVRVKAPVPGKLARWPQYLLLANTVTENGKRTTAEWRKIVPKHKRFISFIRQREGL